MSAESWVNKKGNRRGHNGRNSPNLRPPWKRGESPNPGGFLKNGELPLERLPITQALRRQLGNGKISADELATEAIKLAKKNPRWFQEIADRIEGKPTQRIEVTGDDRALSGQQREEVDERILSLLDRARARYADRQRALAAGTVDGTEPAKDGTGDKS